MPFTIFPGLQDLDDFLSRAAHYAARGEKTITSPFGVHGITYGGDSHDGGGKYAIIGFNLPENVYAEIDCDTYGSLQGFRIYLDEQGAE